MSANDIQIDGDHYKNKAVQFWDFVADAKINNFHICSALKYVDRVGVKHASYEGVVKDLSKTVHFLQKYNELLECLTIQEGDLDFYKPPHNDTRFIRMQTLTRMTAIENWCDSIKTNKKNIFLNKDQKERLGSCCFMILSNPFIYDLESMISTIETNISEIEKIIEEVKEKCTEQ